MLGRELRDGADRTLGRELREGALMLGRELRLELRDVDRCRTTGGFILIESRDGDDR